MLTNRTWIVTQLIDFADRLNDLREDGDKTATRASMATWIECDGDTEPFAFDAIDTDPGCQLVWGRLQGYATLAGYDTVAEMLKQHGINEDMIYKIEARVITSAPEDRREPAPARIYHLLKQTLQDTTRTRVQLGPIVIRNTEADVLDEYARQCAQAIVGTLGL